MADNIQLNPGAGGSVLMADEISAGVYIQRVKPAWGVDGAAVDVSASNPMPVVQTGTPALPTGAATEATLGAISDQLPAALGQTTAAASLSVVLASDQPALEISDGGASVTTDFAGQKTSDYDTGGGTDTVLMVGLALPGSGGAVQGGTATNPVRTDPTGTTTQPVSAASLPLPSGAATEANQSTANGHLATLAGAVSGTEVQADIVAALPAGSNTIGNVNLAQYTPASGRLPVDGSGVNQPVVGAAAHDAAISGAPVRIGMRAASSTVAAVASGDAVDAVADLNGRQVVAPHTIPENSIVGCTAAITDTSGTQLFAAAGAGIRNFLTSLLITNSHASVSTLVEVRDGTTTVIWRGYALAAGGGFAVTFPVPLRGTANTAMNVYCITTGSNVYASGAGYTAP